MPLSSGYRLSIHLRVSWNVKTSRKTCRNTLEPLTHTRRPTWAAVTVLTASPNTGEDVAIGCHLASSTMSETLEFFTLSDLTQNVAEQASLLPDVGSKLLCWAGTTEVFVDMGFTGRAPTLFLPNSSSLLLGLSLRALVGTVRNVKVLRSGNCEGTDGCFRNTGIRLSAGACRTTNDIRANGTWCRSAANGIWRRSMSNGK